MVHVSAKSDHRELHKANKHEKLQLLKLLKMQKDSVKFIKPGQLEDQDEPYLNIIKPLWEVLERSVRSQFPPFSSLKQLTDVLIDCSDKVGICIKGKWW